MLSESFVKAVQILYGWVPTVIVVFLITVAVVQSQGFDPNDKTQHREPLPTGVKPMDRIGYDYLIPNGQVGIATDICHGGISDIDKDDQTLPGYIRVKCSYSQTWSVRERPEISTSKAFSKVSMSPIFWGIAAGGFFIPWMFWLAPDVHKRLRMREQRRETERAEKRHAEERKEKKELEAASIVTAWSKGDISDEQMERAFERIVRKGT